MRNIAISHESSLYGPIDPLLHDPEQAPVPPYHPQTEAVKKDLARYYDEIARMDGQIGRFMEELEKRDHTDRMTGVWFSKQIPPMRNVKND